MAHWTFTMQGYDKAQDIVTTINTLGGKARIGKTWMDYGADISWETILFHHKSLDMECQALDSRDFKEMNEGRLPLERVWEIVELAVKGYKPE